MGNKDTVINSFAGKGEEKQERLDKKADRAQSDKPSIGDKNTDKKNK